MAVTRNCYDIYIGGLQGSSDVMKQLKEKLNKTLGPHERIVHMQQAPHTANTWYVVTEDLIMGPVP